jgi:hypothetical protein
MSSNQRGGHGSGSKKSEMGTVLLVLVVIAFWVFRNREEKPPVSAAKPAPVAPATTAGASGAAASDVRPGGVSAPGSALGTTQEVGAGSGAVAGAAQPNALRTLPRIPRSYLAAPPPADGKVWSKGEYQVVQGSIPAVIGVEKDGTTLFAARNQLSLVSCPAGTSGSSGSCVRFPNGQVVEASATLTSQLPVRQTYDISSDQAPPYSYGKKGK